MFVVACHTLTRINGELAGDPLDLKMLAFTRYELYEPAANEQSNFDMLFPTIVRPIQVSTNMTSTSTRLSGSVSSLLAGVRRLTIDREQTVRRLISLVRRFID
jgi:hypothetical protein